MAEDGGGLAAIVAVVGVAIAAATFMGYNKDPPSTVESVSHLSNIDAGVDAIKSAFLEVVGIANAHAAESPLNVRDYIKTAVARTDVASMSNLVRKDQRAVDPCLKVLSEQLRQIASAYKNERSSATKQYEAVIRADSGATLAYRRQMAVLVEVMRQNALQDSDYAKLADDIQKLFESA